MDTDLKRMNIKKLYENNQFKEIVKLFNINISIEKFNNRASLIKFFDDKSVNIYMKATVWNTKNPSNYESFTSTLTLSLEQIKTISQKEIRKELVNNIYKQVIKNKIMMI